MRGSIARHQIKVVPDSIFAFSQISLSIRKENIAQLPIGSKVTATFTDLLSIGATR